MRLCGENALLAVLVILLILNIIGLSLPIWYKKEHQHSMSQNSTEVLDIGCTVHMNIREGLWQRYCKESWKEGQYCEVDIQEWCDNLDFPEFNSYVVGNEICGEILLMFAFATIIRSKCIVKAYNLEMVSAEIGLAGILMIIGSTVYAAADSAEELNYLPQDLHAGWALCASTGVLCVLLCSGCMCKNIHAKHTLFTRGYLPINDRDEELIEV